jgi:putative membrane protein
VTEHWLRGALVGFVGGLLAAGAMSLAHRLVGEMIPQPAAPPAEDPTVKVASGITRIVGHSLSEAQKPLVGSAVHYTFGASVGAVYGAIAEGTPRVTAGVGLPFGVAVWLGAHVIAVPAFGLAAPPTQQPRSKEGVEFGLHLVYGLVTEVVRRLLRG